jgi:hypothetical protein
VGSVVSIDLTRETAPQLVQVPDLTGKSEEDARGAVEDLELIFDPIGRTDASGQPRRVVRQFPPAGRQVPAGTAVSVDLAAFETEPTNLSRWWLPLLIGVAALGGTTAASLWNRRRSPKQTGVAEPEATRTGAPPRVRAAPQPLGVASIHLDESGPSHRIRIRAHRDPGRQYLQEEPHR